VNLAIVTIELLRVRWRVVKHKESNHGINSTSLHLVEAPASRVAGRTASPTAAGVLRSAVTPPDPSSVRSAPAVAHRRQPMPVRRLRTFADAQPPTPRDQPADDRHRGRSVHPDLDCSSWAPGFVHGEFVEVLHGFRGDSDDLFGRLVDPDADPADVPQRRGDAGAMSAEAFGPSDRAVTIAAISKVLDQR